MMAASFGWLVLVVSGFAPCKSQAGRGQACGPGAHVRGHTPDYSVTVPTVSVSSQFMT